ncbi:branched-chain amino acid ABC transporter permease [Anaeroselena agilis]|uniref:Branched-chain amino acid ABC transporter permease n=1 Tax=Anaeroselena agilis TaxID=3063788 RepID=A0ABU3P0M7_9FIRM|nr:branched-chain amino acid ABC transporter permease [Selenomonadales bacterium 4137-cl]
MPNTALFTRQRLLAWGVSLLGCALLFTALVGSLAVALAVLVVALSLIVLGERRCQMETVYAAMNEHRRSSLAVVILFVVLLPFLFSGNSYLLHVLVMGGIHSIVALGLNFQVGSTGMVNFATAAFFGTGAYASALLATKFAISPWLATAAGTVAAAALGVVFGFPALKTRGYYLSLITIAMQIIFTLMIINTSWLGGPNGVPGIPAYTLGGASLRDSLALPGFSLPYQANYFYLVFLLLGLAMAAASRLYNSRVGLAWNAIEQDEIVAVTQGIDLTSTKLVAFALGAAFAGIAGGLYGHYTSFIGVEDFDFSKSLVFICMVLLGGMDNVVGVVLGALLLTIVDEKLRDFADYRMLMYSVILIVILLSRPQGLLPKRIRGYLPAEATGGQACMTAEERGAGTR